MRRRRGSTPPPAVQAAASAGAPPVRAPNASSTAVPAGAFSPCARELEAPGEHRVDDDPVALEVEVEELARARDPHDTLTRERLELRGGAAHGERHRRARAREHTAREGGVERVGDDVEIGQFGHGRRLYRGKPAC